MGQVIGRRTACLVLAASLVVGLLALHHGRVRVILQPAGSLSTVVDRLTAFDAEGIETFENVNLVAATMRRDQARLLADDPAVAAVTSNRTVQLLDDGETEDNVADVPGVTLDEVAAAIGANQYQARGWDGSGVDVAIIDSGIEPIGALARVLKPGVDLSFEAQDAERAHRDGFGHGTHMAGIVNGIAPGAGLVSVKVADRNGAADVTQIIAALDWVVQNRTTDGRNIQVVNLSMGTDSVLDHTSDPLAYAVEVAWRNGITVCVSAGNRGASAGQLDMPARHPGVLAVAAVDMRETVGRDDDRIADYSSVGTRARRPDVAAPGHRVISVRVPGSFLDHRHPAARVGDEGFRGSGTSQAAAVVSGSAALLEDLRGDLSPDDVRTALRRTAWSLPGEDVLRQGEGLVDLVAARRVSAGSGVAASFTPARGDGALDDARGSYVVEFRSEDGAVERLTGERDFTGAAWNGAGWAGSQWNGSYWNGSTWNGSQWNGSTWNGSYWNGSQWNGSTWNGSHWNGSQWNGSTWNGSMWNGAAWGG